MHFARSIVLGYHSIPKIKWGSFRGRREEKWGSFRGRFGDHFRVGDHFGGCTVPNSLTVYAAERVFTTRILPKLDYCDFVWNNLAPPRYKSFERLQTRAARIYCSEG